MSDPEREERARSLIGSLVANRYRLESLIGLGATGAVYRALHPDGHAVAVKILDPELMGSDAAHRFSRESEVVIGIHHPNVVRTLAAGRDESLGISYLAMPLLTGEDIDSVLTRIGPLDPTAAVRIAIQAARGIGAAHRMGVIHRDIKPANLFLDTERDGRVVIRVCDFGIAKRAVAGGETSFTAPGSQLGTPDYVSPEQLRDSKTVDQRTDVWGLGATLYEMLAGTPPFAHHATVFDVIAAILSEDVPHLQDRAAWIEPGLAAAVHRSLRRPLGERPVTMQELIDALTPFSGGDDALTAAQIAAPSPVVRSVRRPRLELSPVPAPARRSSRPPRGPAAAPPIPAAPASAVPVTPASASLPSSATPNTLPSPGAQPPPVSRGAHPPPVFRGAHPPRSNALPASSDAVPARTNPSPATSNHVPARSHPSPATARSGPAPSGSSPAARSESTPATAPRRGSSGSSGSKRKAPPTAQGTSVLGWLLIVLLGLTAAALVALLRRRGVF